MYKPTLKEKLHVFYLSLKLSYLSWENRRLLKRLGKLYENNR